jgi:hypothetical protein
MQRIQLTEEQSRILAEANGENVEVYDANGQLVSFMKWFEPMDAEEVARYLRRRGLPKQPTIPAAQVQAHLQKLEEIRQREGMDEAKMRDLLRRLRAGEEV